MDESGREKQSDAARDSEAEKSDAKVKIVNLALSLIAGMREVTSCRKGREGKESCAAELVLTASENIFIEYFDRALNFIDKNKRLKGEPPEERKILCCSGIKAAVEQVLDTEGCADGPSRSSP